VIRKHNAVPVIAALTLAAALVACTRLPPGSDPAGARSGEGPATPVDSRPSNTESPAPAGPGSRPASAAPAPQALRPAAPDRLIGTRPLERSVPADFHLGPLENLSVPSSSPRAAAAAAAAAFLAGLAEGRVESAGPGARDVIVFLVGELLEVDSRPTRWRLGEGIPRPEGGWIFPFLLYTRSGRVYGEALAAEAPEAGWGLELVVLDPDAEEADSGQGAGAFDPTIRTVKPTGR